MSRSQRRVFTSSLFRLSFPMWESVIQRGKVEDVNKWRQSSSCRENFTCLPAFQRRFRQGWNSSMKRNSACLLTPSIMLPCLLCCLGAVPKTELHRSTQIARCPCRGKWGHARRSLLLQIKQKRPIIIAGLIRKYPVGCEKLAFGRACLASTWQSAFCFRRQ